MLCEEGLGRFLQQVAGPIFIYIYIHVCICICVCVCVRVGVSVFLFQEKSKDPPIDSSGSQRGSVMALSAPSHGTKTL